MTTWIDTQDSLKVATAIASLCADKRILADNVSVNPDTDGEFALWMVLADKRFTKRFGMGILDMPDFRWHDAFENGGSPIEGLREAIEYWKENGDMPGID